MICILDGGLESSVSEESSDSDSDISDTSTDTTDSDNDFEMSNTADGIYGLSNSCIQSGQKLLFSVGSGQQVSVSRSLIVSTSKVSNLNRCICTFIVDDVISAI
jgi:hypothetical protein